MYITKKDLYKKKIINHPTRAQDVYASLPCCYGWWWQPLRLKKSLPRAQTTVYCHLGLFVFLGAILMC